jgi:hypothetical protein
MIALDTLKYLSGQRLKDAEVLFRKNRNAGAVYLMGYALELSFKRKICQTLGFSGGFPESPADFSIYAIQTNNFTANTGITLNQVRQIKNHDLSKLLIFSGVESTVLSSHYKDWLTVKDWTPEDRYKKQRITNAMAQEYISSAKQILKQIT